MILKLPEDQRHALRDCPNGPIPIEDEETRRRYVLVDAATHQRAIEALAQQDDLAAIQAGIDDMEAGRVASLEEVDARIRAKLGMAPGQ
jgi:predicted transcriptional regulator